MQIQHQTVDKTPSTSTQCNTTSAQESRKEPTCCRSTASNTIPNVSPITSGASSSLVFYTEHGSTRLPLSSRSSSFNDNDVCRICHGGNSTELLLSPCFCSGSMGKIHLSCLQRWLGSCNKSSCEICDFQFSLVRKTKPFKQFLANPGSPRDKRNLMCDLVCFSLLTPLTFTTTWLCFKGAIHLLNSFDKKWESAGLFALAACLLILFTAWALVCFRHNYNLWKDWSQFNQDVKLKCRPPQSTNTSQTEKNSQAKYLKLTTVEIPLQSPPAIYTPEQVRNEKVEHTNTSTSRSSTPSEFIDNSNNLKSENLRCYSGMNSMSSKRIGSGSKYVETQEQSVMSCQREAQSTFTDEADLNRLSNQCSSPRALLACSNQQQNEQSPVKIESPQGQTLTFPALHNGARDIYEKLRDKCFSPGLQNNVEKGKMEPYCADTVDLLSDTSLSSYNLQIPKYVENETSPASGVSTIPSNLQNVGVLSNIPPQSRVKNLQPYVDVCPMSNLQRSDVIEERSRVRTPGNTKSSETQQWNKAHVTAEQNASSRERLNLAQQVPRPCQQILPPDQRLSLHLTTSTVEGSCSTQGSIIKELPLDQSSESAARSMYFDGNTESVMEEHSQLCAAADDVNSLRYSRIYVLQTYV